MEVRPDVSSVEREEAYENEEGNVQFVRRQDGGWGRSVYEN